MAGKNPTPIYREDVTRSTTLNTLTVNVETHAHRARKRKAARALWRSQIGSMVPFAVAMSSKSVTLRQLQRTSKRESKARERFAESKTIKTRSNMINRIFRWANANPTVCPSIRHM